MDHNAWSFDWGKPGTNGQCKIIIEKDVRVPALGSMGTNVEHHIIVSIPRQRKANRLALADGKLFPVFEILDNFRIWPFHIDGQGRVATTDVDDH